MGKFCGKCGKEIEKGVKFCPNCGNTNEEAKETVKAEVVKKTETDEPVSNGTNGFAIAGFVLSFFVPLAGLIFSIIGLNKAKDMNGSGKGFAKAGLILSIIWMVLEVIALIIYYLIVIAAVVGASYY